MVPTARDGRYWNTGPRDEASGALQNSATPGRNRTGFGALSGGVSSEEPTLPYLPAFCLASSSSGRPGASARAQILTSCW
jgi:hypothetical protein